jgi:hypothetical protein
MKKECFTCRRPENHREQLQQRALARTALSDESEFRTRQDIEARNRQLECRVAGAIALDDVAQRENRRAQGNASSNSG